MEEAKRTIRQRKDKLMAAYKDETLGDDTRYLSLCLVVGLQMALDIMEKEDA